MQELSRALVALYEGAEHVSLNAYPAEAMRVLQSLIPLDGGTLGMGTTQADPALVIEQAYVYQRDPVIVPEYGWLSARDPLAGYFAAGLTVPFACRCASFYRELRVPELEAFCRRHALSQLMLFGDAAPQPHAAQWIVLYRSNDYCFGEIDKQYLLALWPHLKHAFAINRRHHLDRQVRSHDPCAAALVNRHGAIEAAHPCFHELLDMEWPGFAGSRVPDVVMGSWRQGHAYIGARIRIAMRMQEELIVCVAMHAAMPAPLTRAERIVASQFAGGSSHKAIAENLGVSQHTVRSHIAHIYTKLDIHDKAALANKLGSGAGCDEERD